MVRSTIIMGVLVIILSMPAYCDEIIIQGTGLIEETIHALEAAIVHINVSESVQTGSAIENAEKSWDAFKEHYDFVFENELTQSEEIKAMITSITARISDLKTTCEQIVDNNDTDAVQATIDNLNELESLCSIPVLFDFTGASCKSCKIMKERLQTVAEDVQGSARVVIIDVNSQKNYSKKFKIMLIPTLVFMDDEGKEVARHVGQMEVQAITAKLSELSE